MKTVAGKVRFNHYLNGSSNFFIEVEDASSGLPILKLEPGPAEVATFMKNMSTDCEVKVFENERFLGSRREVKREIIPFKTASYVRADMELHARAALVDYSVDGWKGHWEDLLNHHNARAGGQQVTFWRYVDAETGEPLT